jgi:hypothetical protein
MEYGRFYNGWKTHSFFITDRTWKDFFITGVIWRGRAIPGGDDGFIFILIWNENAGGIGDTKK